MAAVNWWSLLQREKLRWWLAQCFATIALHVSIFIHANFASSKFPNVPTVSSPFLQSVLFNSSKPKSEKYIFPMLIIYVLVELTYIIDFLILLPNINKPEGCWQQLARGWKSLEDWQLFSSHTRLPIQDESPLQSPSFSPHGSSAEQQLLVYSSQVAGLHRGLPGGLQLSFSFSGSPWM